MDYYDLETYDFPIVSGDTANLPFEFVDTNGDPIDVSQYASKFTVVHPVTKEIIPMVSDETEFSKIRDDSFSGGKGIFYTGDTNLTDTLLSISKVNQLVVVMSYEDTGLLVADLVYPFDIEFESLGAKFTVARGSLVVKRERTPSA